MSETVQDSPVEGATLVTEAVTAEAALAEVHAELGPDARILDARRVLRGGVGGFFARELVQVHAAPGRAPSPLRAPSTAPPGPSAPPPVGAPTGPATSVSDEGPSPIERLLADADAAPEAVDFATYLRDQLGRTASAPTTATPAGTDVSQQVRHLHASLADERPAWVDAAPAAAQPAAVQPAAVQPAAGQPQVAPPAAVQPISPADVAAEPAPADDGGPQWSVTTLVRLGLPPELVRSIRVDEPADDVAWTTGLAAALRPLCRPLPAGRSLLVGPRARGIAKARNVPVVNVGQPIRTRGDVAAAVGTGKASRGWLDKVVKGRWVHLVVGGSGWRTLLHTDPLAVSWASPEDLPDAVRTAVELGLVLGHGPLDGQVGRARPLDVALAIRDLVPGR